MSQDNLDTPETMKFGKHCFMSWPQDIFSFHIKCRSISLVHMARMVRFWALVVYSPVFWLDDLDPSCFSSWTGAKYDLPKYVLSEPTNVKEDEQWFSTGFDGHILSILGASLMCSSYLQGSICTALEDRCIGLQLQHHVLPLACVIFVIVDHQLRSLVLKEPLHSF